MAQSAQNKKLDAIIKIAKITLNKLQTIMQQMMVKQQWEIMINKRKND